jgi:predicted glycosyltransferase
VKILIYCQHVLGVGHFFRTLEIIKALESHGVVLVTGGDRVDVTLPDHVSQIELPGIMMDGNFSGLNSIDPGKNLDDVKSERRKLLLDIIKTQNPDLFIIELFPFGRKAFRFELIPVLEYIKEQSSINCKVVCSLRDILVEKENRQKHEKRVVDALNTFFDAVLVHSDPKLIKLDSTFSQINQIKIPIVYTGFVTPLPNAKKVEQIREKIRSESDEFLVVASVGGGNVGTQLLKAVVQVFKTDYFQKKARLYLFTGPYMDNKDKQYFKGFTDSSIIVKEFADNFVSLLAASDLSISMAGYNTCMNIVAAKIPSLVWPFSQNREQRQRAGKIAKLIPLTILEDEDLAIQQLSKIIKQNLEMHRKQESDTAFNLDINGALNTSEWIGDNI